MLGLGVQAKEYRAKLAYCGAVDEEYVRVRNKALIDNLILPESWGNQAMSPLADDLERTLEEQLTPLGTAYILTAAMASLAATAVVYSGDTVSWPPSPVLIQELTVVALACVYVGVVRLSMKRAGRAAALRVDRMTLSSLNRAGLWLSDNTVGGVVRRPNSEGGQALLKELSSVAASADLPLRHRALGQYHLALAWQQLPLHRSDEPCVSDFESLAPDANERKFVGEKRFWFIYRELGLAQRHLKKAVAEHGDDPVAMVALAGALDADAAVHGAAADSQVSDLVTDAYILATARDITDNAWNALLTVRFHWLWPRDPGPLAQFERTHQPGFPKPLIRGAAVTRAGALVLAGGRLGSERTAMHTSSPLVSSHPGGDEP